MDVKILLRGLCYLGFFAFSILANANHVDTDIDIVEPGQPLELVSSQDKAYFRITPERLDAIARPTAQAACEALDRDFVEFTSIELPLEDREEAIRNRRYSALIRNDAAPGRIQFKWAESALAQTFVYYHQKRISKLESASLLVGLACTAIGGICAIACGSEEHDPWKCKYPFAMGAGGSFVAGGAVALASKVVRSIFGKGDEVPFETAQELIAKGRRVTQTPLTIKDDQNQITPLYSWPLIAEHIWCRDREGWVRPERNEGQSWLDIVIAR